MSKILLFKYTAIYLTDKTDENLLNILTTLGQIMKYYHIIPQLYNCNPLKQTKTAKDIIFDLSKIGINDQGHYLNLENFLTNIISFN